MAAIGRVKEIKNWEAWALQRDYWIDHLDVFIQQRFGVRLKDTQQVIAREIGRCDEIKVVESRGYGKTW